jgi:hypothetical protein
MRMRTILTAAATLAAGALLGWLTPLGHLAPGIQVQDTVLPQPQSPFKGISRFSTTSQKAA